MKEIYKKIAAAKKEIGAISKDTTNDFFKAKYYDINKLIEIVEPELEKQGLLLLQPIFDGKVITRIIDIKTGEELKSEMELPKQDNPQKIGSAITYYRRYTLASLLALQAEDDDGNNAAKPEPPKKPTEEINLAIEEIGLCTSLQELGKVWTKHNNLQKYDEVLAAKNARKELLSNCDATESDTH